jgi:transcriptional regulator with XRE-family HTH domain
LAERVGVEPSYLSLLESGKRQNPSSKLLDQFAKALGIPLDLLVLLAAEDAELRGVTTGEAARIGEAMMHLLHDE